MPCGIYKGVHLRAPLPAHRKAFNMSSQSRRIQPRSRSVPLPLRPSGRSHPRNLLRVIAALEKVKIQSRRRQSNDQRLALARQKLQDDANRPQFLMPRYDFDFFVGLSLLISVIESKSSTI